MSDPKEVDTKFPEVQSLVRKLAGTPLNTLHDQKLIGQVSGCLTIYKKTGIGRKVILILQLQIQDEVFLNPDNLVYQD